MDKNLKFYDLFQHADFINERHGMDSIAVDSIPIPGAEVDPEWKNYIIPTWVADQSFKTCPAIQDAVIARAKHPAFGYFKPRDEYFEGIIRWQKNQYDSDVTKEDIVYDYAVNPKTKNVVEMAVLTFAETIKGYEVK